MNGLSIRELCCLFCCPPCPSRIAAKLAFLPPEPTYALIPDPDPGSGTGTAGCSSGAALPSLGAPGLRSRLSTGSGGDRGGAGGEFQYSQRELDVTDVFLTRSSRGNRVGCMYIRCAPNARFTVLFSHGNAVDLGQMSSFYIGLGTRINCNIFSYDYSGYGVSTGKPSEKNLYADIDAAWHALRSRYGISPENIILYGQSIGTVPTVDLASRFECAAVVLHSPLTSGMRVAFPDTKKTYCFDAFPNIEKVSKIPSPVLIIHGTEDEVIDFSHGLALFERCPKAVEPLWVEGAGHNDIELYSQYLERLRRFINQDLAAQHA
uniref:palmitoyl-protein hydrolase n=1 Tax=Monopterus albus TaxID=43700 RepID=A0A3Q3RC17_MONAL|nr:protein ABHD17A-like [Monopterus albus]